MWYALVDPATGTLESLGTVLPTDAQARFVVIPLGDDRPDLAAVRWNDALRAFEPRPAQEFRAILGTIRWRQQGERPEVD